MNELLMYLLGIIASFIMSVIAFRFKHLKFGEFVMPVIIFVWLTSWIGAALMSVAIITSMVINNSILNKVYTKLTNGFVKLIGNAK